MSLYVTTTISVAPMFFCFRGPLEILHGDEDDSND